MSAPVHGRLPDVSANAPTIVKVCGSTDATAPWTWDVNRITCRSCRSRIASRPQLANIMLAASAVEVPGG
jgi:hypothetical protein